MIISNLSHRVNLAILECTLFRSEWLDVIFLQTLMRFNSECHENYLTTSPFLSPCRHVLPAVPQRAQLVQHALQPLRQRQPRLRTADAGQAAPAAPVRQGKLPGEN